MSLFSQRKKIRPLTKALQREALDDELRNRLWSATQIAIWDHWEGRDYYGRQSEDSAQAETVVNKVWLHYFKRPLDTVPRLMGHGSGTAYAVMRQHFLEGAWWEALDFLEFLIKTAPDEWAQPLRKLANRFLQEENSAYRVVADEIVEITNEREVEAIETALDSATKESQTHLLRALDLLSDRKHPDYRNSIKESISAVEAVCRTFTANPKATLGDCIKVIREKGTVHPAFEQGLLKLYGYTSDASGIRHALTEDSVLPSYADAKFMLVAASAFINYLWTKASELGVDFTK